MRIAAIAFMVVSVLLASSCGNGNSNTASNVTGNWTATLSGTNGQPGFAFTMSLNQSSSNSVSATNVNFTSGAPCFQQLVSQNGTFTLNGTFNGATTNTLQLTLVGGEAGESTFNTLTMQGSVSNNTISGSWAMQGLASGCTGSGTFTMNRS